MPYHEGMGCVSPEVRGSVAPQVESLTGLDPWQACQRLAVLPHLLFFDSAQPGGPRGRFSFVTADPFAWITAHGDTVTEDGRRRTGDPLRALGDRLAQLHAEH